MPDGHDSAPAQIPGWHHVPEVPFQLWRSGVRQHVLDPDQWRWLHHQMHHRYFEVHYGNLEMPWDKWFDSFHDGTPEAHERLKGRRQRRA